MEAIVQAMTYRGKILDHGISLTTNKFPQFVAELVALEAWDVDEEEWVDWSDVGQNGIMAYLVLFGNKGETLTCQQIKKITGWDGTSFTGLADMDLSEVVLQFRVEEHTYDNKTSLQVSWIDEEDAVPGRSVKKLDAAELKSIDAQYASLLKKSAVAAAPAKAPVKSDKKSKKSTKPVSPGTVKAKGIKPTQNKGPVTKSDDTETSPLAPPDVPATTTTETEKTTTDIFNLPTSCDKTEAWNLALKHRADGVNDEAFSNAWVEAVGAVDDGKGQDGFDDTEWAAVLHAVLDSPACTSVYTQ